MFHLRLRYQLDLAFSLPRLILLVTSRAIRRYKPHRIIWLLNIANRVRQRIRSAVVRVESRIIHRTQQFLFNLQVDGSFWGWIFLIFHFVKLGSDSPRTAAQVPLVLSLSYLRPCLRPRLPRRAMGCSFLALPCVQESYSCADCKTISARPYAHGGKTSGTFLLRMPCQYLPPRPASSGLATALHTRSRFHSDSENATADRARYSSNSSSLA